MNRRFFLSGLIAAPIVAGAPLARFIMPAPRGLTDAEIIAAAIRILEREAERELMRIAVVERDYVFGYRLGDTIQIRMPREFSVRGLNFWPVDEVRDYVVTDIATAD